MLSLTLYSQIYTDSLKSGDTTLNIRHSGNYNYALIYMYNYGVRTDTIVTHIQSYRKGYLVHIGLVDLFNTDSTSYKYIVIAPSTYRVFYLPYSSWFRFTSLGRIVPGEKRVDIEVDIIKD